VWLPRPSCGVGAVSSCTSCRSWARRALRRLLLGPGPRQEAAGRRSCLLDGLAFSFPVSFSQKMANTVKKIGLQLRSRLLSRSAALLLLWRPSKSSLLCLLLLWRENQTL
jgi:hypothetical protein